MILLPPERVVEMIKDLETDQKKLREQIADVCVYMGGGLDYSTAWTISYEDREHLVQALNRKAKKENPNSKEYM